MEIQAAEPRAWESSPRPNATPRSGPAARPGAPHAPPRGGFTRFLMSWGTKHGATASRCMSHVCRRGDITRHMIGAIDVHLDSTSIEVSDEVAADFEQRCQTPDARDPHVRITRQGSVVQPRSIPPRADQYAFKRPRPPRNEPPRHEIVGPELMGPTPGPRVKRAARRQRPLARPPEA